MDLGLKGKRALVTGSTVGIGFSIAQQLAREGATVYINGRTKERVEEAIKKIREAFPKADLLPLALDLSKKEGVEKLAAQFSEIDILVNNLGIYEVKDFFEITDEDWLKIFEINVLSGIRLSRYFLPGMKKKGWGRVVFISSESALNIPTEMIHYGLTKTAQLSLTQGLAQVCKATGVTVNAVLPGPTWSEGVEKFIEDLAKSQNKSVKEVEQEFFKNVRPNSLISRFATTDEVAALVTFVCSEQAAAITGASLRVDGGVTRSIA